MVKSLTNHMEVDGMLPWKTTFLYEQGVFSTSMLEKMCSSPTDE